MANIEKMSFLNPPVLNIALDPENENDMYMIKCMADALVERIEIVDSYYVMRKLAKDLAAVCDFILEAEDKKSPDCGNSQEPF